MLRRHYFDDKDEVIVGGDLDYHDGSEQSFSGYAIFLLLNFTSYD